MGYDNCCGPGYGRRYWTKEERIEGLKEYQDALEKELAAVKERVARIEKE